MTNDKTPEVRISLVEQSIQHLDRRFDEVVSALRELGSITAAVSKHADQIASSADDTRAVRVQFEELKRSTSSAIARETDARRTAHDAIVKDHEKSQQKIVLAQGIIIGAGACVALLIALLSWAAKQEIDRNLERDQAHTSQIQEIERRLERYRRENP